MRSTRDPEMIADAMMAKVLGSIGGFLEHFKQSGFGVKGVLGPLASNVGVLTVCSPQN